MTIEISQSSGPIHLDTDETVYKEWEDRMERAATTASSLDVEQDSGNINRTQSMATLNKSIPQGTNLGSGPRCQDTILGGAEAQIRFKAASKQSNDPPLSRVNTLRSGEDNMKLKELMELCTKLSERILDIKTNRFWTSAKAKTINRERQIQALVDKKKVIITETSIKSDLKLDDAEGTDCLPTAINFAELERISAKTTSWNEFSSTMASAIICLATNQQFNFSKYIFDNMVKNLEGGIKFIMYPRKDNGPTEPIPDEAINEEHVATPSCDPPQSGEDRMQLTELMDLCTQLQSRVLALETTKSNQALEIESLKRRVKSLEKRRKSRTPGFKRLRKGRKIADLDADAEVTLVDETQEMNDDNLMFDTGVLEEQEKEVAEKEVSAADPVTTVGEVVTTANVEVTTANAPTTTIDELTLAQTLIEIKAAKPKAVTSAATTTTTTRPKARGVVVQEPSEFKTTSSPLQASQLPQAKDKGKAKMVEPEKPLKKKDQIAMDEEVARNLEAQLQAELEEEERISRLKEEKANIALLESWDNTQAMMDADFQLAQQMQTEEQEQLSIEEKSKLFVELLEKRKKHFAALELKKNDQPTTKHKNRNTMSTYLKNMAGYKHNQLKSKSYDEIQEMFDKEMKRVNTFVDMNTELVKSSETRTEGSSKRAGDELESDNSKKQKIDEHVEAEKDNDQEEAEMKKHIEIVKDDEVAIDAIPLATKPPVLVKYKIVKEEKFVYFQLIRADGSSKRYLTMIKIAP
ncbi:hypothetical protein Tco_0391081 [Tanacetum coccineum]